MQPVSEAGDATAASSSEQKPLCCRRVWELERSSVSQIAWKAVQWDWSVCEKEGIVCTVCVTVWSCAFLSGEEEGALFVLVVVSAFSVSCLLVALWECMQPCNVSQIFWIVLIPVLMQTRSMRGPAQPHMEHHVLYHHRFVNGFIVEKWMKKRLICGGKIKY